MPLEGFAERQAGNTIQGWAWDTDNPEQPILLEAFDGAAFYERVLADQFRDELKTQGKRAGLCSFSVTLPPSAAAEIHVLVDGTGHRLRTSPSTDIDPVLDWLDGPGGAIRPNLLVHRLCHDLLGRSATPLELLRFADRTATSYGIVRLVRDIVDQAPGMGLLTHRDIIRHAYLGVLGRAADQGGLSSFGNALLTGMPVSQMIRDLIASPEFATQYASTVKPDGQAELQQLAKTLEAAVTTLLLHAVHPVPPQPSPDLAADR